MASKENRVYRSHKPIKTWVVALLILLALLIALIIGVFFGFQRYITYTDNGVRLDVPWLQEAGEQSGE